jgi:hypothetical protein
MRYSDRFCNLIVGSEYRPNRYVPKSEFAREFRLIRRWEADFERSWFAENGETQLALLDFNTQHEMVLYADRGGWFYVWTYNRDYDAWESDLEEFDSYEGAYEFFVKNSQAPVEPDWEAQARYDEEHGTINGEDPGIVAMRELGY